MTMAKGGERRADKSFIWNAPPKRVGFDGQGGDYGR
jgi:hypothetical protein